jgi:hypothetical protein
MNVIAQLLCAFLPGLPQEGIWCGIEVPTVRQMVDGGHIVVVGKWVSVEKPIPHQTVGRTKYQVVQITQDTQKTLEGKTEFVLERYWPGEPGNLFLLYDSQARKGEWNTPVPISRTSLGYIKEVAALHVIDDKWLEFFVSYLEDPDPFVANDAYREVEEFSFKEIQAISSKLPREKLHNWVKSDATEYRRGLYSLLLGLCGDDEDAALLADFIKKAAKESRPGIDGVMCGYLLLQGKNVLKLLDETKLKASNEAPFGETYAAMRALYFAWEHTDIPRDRLKKSMRLLLDHPILADLAIGYLTHWKDWEVQDRVVELYDLAAFNPPARKQTIQLAVLRYLLTCGKDSPENADGNPSEEHAMTAEKHLGTLREKDSATVKQAERYFEIFYSRP